MSPARYDVIVSGAGPAGSTAARECASRGLSVLQLDKATFPRDKPCGGAVAERAAALLPFSLDPVVERTAHRARISLRGTGAFEPTCEFSVHLTQRTKLDAFLVERAVAAGVTLREREQIQEIERSPSQVLVRTRSETFTGRALVAADGANGTTAELAGIPSGMVRGVALEGNLHSRNGFPAEWSETIAFDYGVCSGGYGWVFPKCDHLNLGVGGFRHTGPNLRERLAGIVRSFGYDPADLRNLRGHNLPVRQRDTPLAAENVLLVGDAAGLLDPLMGEGIYAAIWSGCTAARHLAEYADGRVADLGGYQRELDAEFMPELRVCRRLHDLLHIALAVSPKVALWTERQTSFLFRMVSSVYGGEHSYVSYFRRRPRLDAAISLLSDLMRVSPPLQRLADIREPALPQRFFARRSAA